MGAVNVAINGQTYTLACRDGEEARLQELSEIVDSKAHELSRRLGQVGETRLMVMVALLLADALQDSRQGTRDSHGATADGEDTAIRLLADAEARVAALAERLESGAGAQDPLPFKAP